MKTSNGVSGRIFTGLVNENAVLKTALAICPALAVTSTAAGGLLMGLLTLIVLVCSKMTVSALCGFIPKNARIPVFLIVSAMFTTVLQILSKSFFPSVNDALGIYFPLITVSCVLMGGFNPSSTAKKDGKRGESAADILLGSLITGASFAFTLCVVGIVREALGMGTVFGFSLTNGYVRPLLIASTAPGGFLTLGFFAALINRTAEKKAHESEQTADDADCRENVQTSDIDSAAKTNGNEGDITL